MAFSQYQENIDQADFSTPVAPRFRHVQPESGPPTSPLTDLDDSEFPDQYYASSTENDIYNKTITFWNTYQNRTAQEDRLKAFLKGLILPREGEEARHSTNRIKRFIKILSDEKIQSRLAKSPDWENFKAPGRVKFKKEHTQNLRQELVSLSQQPGFRRQPGVSDQSLDTALVTEALCYGPQSALEHAPTWHGLLSEVMLPRRANWDSYNRDPARKDELSIHVSKLIYVVLAIMTKAAARNTGNFLPNLVGRFLLASGAKRDVIEVVHGMGLADSYSSLISQNRDMSMQAKVHQP